MSLGWNFPSNNNGEIIGIGEAGIETFRGSLFSSLAREICQNSLDARKDYTKPVKVEFSLSNVEKNNIPDFHMLKDAMVSCKNFWKENQKTVKFFDNAIDICNRNLIRVLRISDFNTCGLTGSDKIKSSPWQDLVKSSGVSNKGGESGGSYGIGKSAPYACSDLRTIFYNTLDENGLMAYQGVAKLVSFKDLNIHDNTGQITQGKGYYGEMDTNSPVRNIISIDGYQRTEVGTDVIILGFINHSTWENEVIKSVIEGYLLSIINNDLEVIVNDVVINKDTIHQLIKKYKEEIPLTHNYYEVLTDNNTVCIKENFHGLGIVELYVLIKKDFRRKVLVARNNGMKIFDKKSISSTIQFAGVCILKDKRLNEYFREMENPQHNDWEPDRHSNKIEAKRYKRDLFAFIKSKILEIGRTTITDEMDAIGAGEYIPDLSDIDGIDESKNENINNEIKDFTKLKKVDIKKNNRGKQSIDDMDMEGDIKDIGTLDEDGLYAATEYNHGNGKRNGKVRTNEYGKGRPDEKGNEEIRKNVSIKPLNMRLFMYDNDKGLYKLSFVPDKTASNSYIEIYMAGEQNNSSVEIKDVKTIDEQKLKFYMNKILLGNVEKGKKYSLLYSIKYKEMCSMGVIIRGNKI